MFNPPTIHSLCNIVNLFECVAMFYFVKRLSIFGISAQPFSNRLLLSIHSASFFLGDDARAAYLGRVTDLTTSYTSSMSLRIRASSSRAIEFADNEIVWYDDNRGFERCVWRGGVRVISKHSNIGISPFGFAFFTNDSVDFAIIDHMYKTADIPILI